MTLRSNSAHDPSPPPAPARPLRTLNNIHSAHVIQLHPDRSPNLSAGKRKTAVELLAESKASFYDRKQQQQQTPLAESLPGTTMLQHHPNRSPMLQPSHASIRIREHHALPLSMTGSEQAAAAAAAPGSIGGGAGVRTRQREGYYTTPPVEKRRLSIRKADNPMSTLNVTAVRRFLSRPVVTAADTAEMHGVQMRKVAPFKSGNGSGNRLIGFFSSSNSNSSSSQPAASGGTLSSSAASGSGVSPTNTSKKPGKSRITFSEAVLPCICQSSQPPELPHRMSRNNPSPPPPIPPKSPALNAKLRLLSQQQLASCAAGSMSSPRMPPSLPSHSNSSCSLKPTHATSVPPEVKDPATSASLFRRIQSEEAPVKANPLPAEPSSRTTAAVAAPAAVSHSSLLRHHHGVLHKSLPDLNSPKITRRGGRHGCIVGGKIRSASTDLDSCSDSGSSSRMSRSSSVHLDTASSSDESSNESEPRCFRPGPTAVSRSERATTSDYASRSPSFKYETTSLVQASQTCWILPPPWLDDNNKQDPLPESGPLTEPTATIIMSTSKPAATTSAEQINRRRAYILRSKSDVGPSRFAPDLLPAVPPEFTGDVPEDLDNFFDTIGHQQLQDSAISLDHSGRSSPVYFSSVSSVDSYCRARAARHVDNAGESSDSEDMAATLQRRLLGSQPGMGEPSIIERNARIIKWLIKCRNVPAPIPASGSTGQLMKLASSTLTTNTHPPLVPIRATHSNNNNNVIPSLLGPMLMKPSSSGAGMAAVAAGSGVPPPASPLFYGQSTRL